MDKSRTEVYHHCKPWTEDRKLITGFKYDVVGQPTQEKFYGVGCRTFWYQWNCPEDDKIS